MVRPVVILDTNVFVGAGFRPASTPGRVVAAVRAGDLRHVWHVRTRAETQRILTQVPRLGWAPVADLFDDDDRHDGDLDIDAPAYAVIADRHDRKYAALAAATGAVVVTGDSDLLGVKQALSVTILRPSEVLRRLDGEGGA